MDIVHQEIRCVFATERNWMKPATMLNVDFNSLRVLRYVYENQSFSIAAEKLGVSQSVVS
ncbi:helix-turn-helix domain-containing protein [Thalassovita taeanensis]|uniref:helix-turn-helix domain-containing protein n=1 Tax=Thalassovita taeanensis TaxID=657014 RepID=UPI001114FBAF